MIFACVEGLACARKFLESPNGPILPSPASLPIARKFLETFNLPYMSRGQVAYFDQRADRAALASQTTPNSDIPFIKYKKVSRLRRNYPQNALFPTPYIGGKVPELTGTHRNSPGTTPGTHPGTHPWNLACFMVLSWVLVWLGQPSLFFLIAACKHKTIALSVSLSLSL